MSKSIIMSDFSLLSAASFCCLSLIFCVQVLGLAAPAPSPSHNLTNSLYVAVNAAIDEASYTLDRIKLQHRRFNSGRESAALSDCSEFYELAILHLDKTLEPDPNTTPFDVQIWLSAALTSLENCRTSMSELNITHPTFIDRSNALELISKSLAINAEIMKGTGDGGKNLHRWFPDEDFVSFSKSDLCANIVVAMDGLGDYRTIKEALHASRTIEGRVVIHIKQGTYCEYLEIGPHMKNIMLIGDGIGKTIITGNRSARTGFTTRKSSTIMVMGDGFVARDITFRNSAGVDAGQAVALLSSSDRSAYYRCAFEGYQDTLWVDFNRQFYRECEIYGTIDFIFGNAAAVIQNSIIYARAPKKGQAVSITAQGRERSSETTGISIINCKILPDPSQKEKLRGVRVFLGRPWKSYARTVYMKSYLDGMVDPVGWMDWNSRGENRTLTVYYAEYQNYGPGSSTRGRVKWKGVKVINDVGEALKFNVAKFIGGLTWLPSIGVPFYGGLFF